MDDSRDFSRGAEEAAPECPDQDQAAYRWPQDERARYLAKAASLGQVVAEEPPDIRRP